jgi:hypothetical protein
MHPVALSMMARLATAKRRYKAGHRVTRFGNGAPRSSFSTSGFYWKIIKTFMTTYILYPVDGSDNTHLERILLHCLSSRYSGYIWCAR